MARPRKKLFVSGITLVSLLGLAVVITWSAHRGNAPVLGSGAAIIEEQSDGFHPGEVRILLGEEVKFTSKRGQPFWPASDLHPSHTIYPEFDPKHPIAPTESWSFRFDKVGTWGFHDHLFPDFTGKVVVVMANSSARNDSVCRNLNSKAADGQTSEQYRCWDNLVSQEMKTKGVTPAMDLIASLYDSNANLGSLCHDLAHKVGKEAYKVFAQTQTVALDSKTGYCGYGFYHGFMDELIVSGVDLTKARDFCNLAKEQLAGEADTNCYHGIGHGVAEKHTSDTTATTQDLIDPGLEVCDRVADSYERLTNCADGVFSSVMIYLQTYRNQEFLNHSLISLCLSQREQYLEACYRGAGGLQLPAYRNNFPRAAELIKSIPSQKFAGEYVRQISLARGRLITLNNTKQSRGEAIGDCRAIDPPYQEDCVAGLVISLTHEGAPGKEYLAGLDLCQMDNLTDDLRSSCYRQFIITMRQFYPEDKFKQFCQYLPQEWQRKCEG